MAALPLPEIIVIDSDDDDELETIPAEDEGGTEKSTMVDTFMEIMNLSRHVARRFLQKHQFHLEQAIAARLEQDQQKQNKQYQKSRHLLKNVNVDKKAPDADAANVSTTVVAPRLSRKRARGQQSLVDDMDDHRNRHKFELDGKESAQSINASLASPQFFRDAAFPPEIQSLDGRKRKNNRHSDNNNNNNNHFSPTPHCHCGLPASARQVQSDGPNYGKFYLGCGQQGVRKLSRSSSPKNNPPPCNFFQWDEQGVLGAQLLADRQTKAGGTKDGYGATRFALLSWQHFGKEHGCVLYNTTTGINPSQVQQGAVGNCWFLSALAVVAEKPYLVQQLLPHTQLNDAGCYQVNLCLDGRWTSVVVDSYLPVVVRERSTDSGKARKGQRTLDVQLQNRDCVPYGKNLVAFPAFCATPQGQLWAALVEKAYGKVHGSYAQLSGGFICEGLFDLTGAPFETIVLQGRAFEDKELLWARLLSFHEAGFLMGVATNKGGDGLVGGHAYSVLNVIEVSGKLIGEQKRVTHYFEAPRKPNQSATNDQSEVIHINDTQMDANNYATRQTIRLVRIRNPWGKREWKGAWSASSEQWTKSLRKALGKSTYAKGDGTFFMSFDDMIDRFHHMDVGKTRQGWVLSCVDAAFTGQRDPLHSCSRVYKLEPAARTNAFVSIVQPKKRSQTGNDFWYVDPNFVILRRRNRKHWPDSRDEWVCEVVCLEGVRRISTCEIPFNPEEHEYVLVPLSTVAANKGSSVSSHFRICCYSGYHVSITECNQGLNEYYKRCASILQTHLLEAKTKHVYHIAQRCALLCLHGPGCLYFVALNGKLNTYLSIKLNVKIPLKGIISPFGCNGGTIDVPPGSQRILFVAMGDGKMSAATQLAFSYLSDSVELRGAPIKQVHSGRIKNVGLGSNIDLTVNAKLHLASVESSPVQARGGGIADTYLWIPQLGATRSVRWSEIQGSRDQDAVNDRSVRELTSTEKQSVYAEARKPLNVLHNDLARLKRELHEKSPGSTEFMRLESEIEILQHALIPAAKTKSYQAIWQTMNTAGDLALMNHRGNVELDFHGLHQDEAKAIFDDMIIPFLPHVRSFHLIVGKGKHSQGKIAKLKPALYEHILVHEKRKHIHDDLSAAELQRSPTGDAHVHYIKKI